MRNITKILSFLSTKEKSQAVILLILTIIMALLDIIGIASIVPFISVISDQNIISNNKYLNYLYFYFEFENYTQFSFFIGISVFFILIFSLLFKSFTTYIQLRFIYTREYTISMRYMKGYIFQKYNYFLNKNSSDISKNVLSEVSTIVGGIMLPFITATSHFIVSIFIIFFLLLVNFKIAIIVTLSLGLFYTAIFYIVRVYLKKIGEGRFQENKKRFSSVSEAFKGIKEVKLYGLEDYYISKFKSSAYVHAIYQANSQLVGQLPRFALEAVAFGGILILVSYLTYTSKNFVEIIPLISIYAFAGYRLMPSLQQIYSNMSLLRFSDTALDNLYNELHQLKYKKNLEKNNNLIFEKELRLENIYYRYPNSSNNVLEDINLKIPNNSHIGLVGVTGSGKTTLIDLILGLLEPTRGEIFVDNTKLNDSNIQSWQSIIGYVPQMIYLSDDTIISNVALGLEEEEISIDKVIKSCEISHIKNFIESELDNNYYSIVGENGVRLSGGQRQRLGIARALYKVPKVLILDEATSALDNRTEMDIINSLRKLNDKITIIKIAHRLSTVEKCDLIYVFDKGKIVSQGTYEYLSKNSMEFLNLLQKK